MKKSVLRIISCLFSVSLLYAGEFEKSLIPDGGFETEDGWTVMLEDGAQGTWRREESPVRSGAFSMRLTKTNGVGYIRLTSTKPIPVKAGVKYRFRGWFHSEDAPVSSLLLFRVSPERNGNLAYDSIDRSAGWSSQSLVVNSPTGEWKKRVIHFKPQTDKSVYLHVVLYGNPCTVWLDDLLFTARPYRRRANKGSFGFPYSKEEVYKILETRENASARIEKRNGRTVLVLNSKPVPPVLLKENPYRDTSYTQAYEDFGQAGISLAIRTVMLSGIKNNPGVCEGKGKYRWDLLEEDLMLALRRNPHAYLVVNFTLYQPYPGWGEKYSEECWMNAKGERGYGWWGNLEGFTDDLKKVDTSRKKHWWYPSYNSRRWREDTARALRDVIAHLMESPLGKAVVGYNITGGHDGQFQTHIYDYSPASLHAFRAWLQKKYGTIEQLNQAWSSSLESFDEVGLHSPSAGGAMERDTPFLVLGLETDCLAFQRDLSWDVRDYFAGVVKEASSKSVFTIAYGMPAEYEFWPLMKLRSLDASAEMSYYPFRLPGYALGVKPEGSFHFYGKLWIDELDLRSWASGTWNEVYQKWIGAGLTPRSWDAIHRKMLGVALAHDLGWWYYSMNRYFDDPLIMGHIAKTYVIAKSLQGKGKSVFRPDVCVVRTNNPNRFISARFSAGRLTATMPFQEMMMETSGVPYDLHYLNEILARSDLQNYKVYVFLHTIYLTVEERRRIGETLKGGGRTLVWIYNTGYVSEAGKSIDTMSNLVGVKIGTKEEYERGTPIILPDSHPLTEHVMPFQGMGELCLTIMRLQGANSFIARPQPFWVEDESATPLARYRENKKVAIAMKVYDDWTSVYLGAPFSLGNDLLHNIARRADAFVCGKPGQSIFMNGNFVSLHGMRSERYTLRLPPGAKRVVDPDTNRVLAENVSEYTFWVEAGQTYWFFLE